MSHLGFLLDGFFSLLLLRPLKIDGSQFYSGSNRKVNKHTVSWWVTSTVMTHICESFRNTWQLLRSSDATQGRCGCQRLWAWAAFWRLEFTVTLFPLFIVTGRSFAALSVWQLTVSRFPLCRLVLSEFLWFEIGYLFFRRTLHFWSCSSSSSWNRCCRIGWRCWSDRLLMKDRQFNGAFFPNACLNLVHLLRLTGQHQTKLVAKIIFEIDEARVRIDMFRTFSPKLKQIRDSR